MPPNDFDHFKQVPAILDIEASGFGKGAYPIEIGCVLHDGRTYCTLIYPELDWTAWSSEAEKIHGIKREALFVAGKPAQMVARELNELLHGITLFSDGWPYDYGWLNLLYEAADMTPSFKLDALQKLLNEEQIDHWLDAVTHSQHVLAIQRHRASSDARIQQHALVGMLGMPLV